MIIIETSIKNTFESIGIDIKHNTTASHIAKSTHIVKEDDDFLK